MDTGANRQQACLPGLLAAVWVGVVVVGCGAGNGGADPGPGDVVGDVPGDVPGDTVQDVPGNPPPDPSAWGPHGVGVRAFDWKDTDRSNRPVPGLVYYPAAVAAVDPSRPVVDVDPTWGFEVMGMPALYAVEQAAPDPAGAPYPVVAFSHGSGGQKEMYKFLLEFLASHGFVSVIVDHTGNVGFGQSEPADLTMTYQRLVDVRFALDRLKDANAAGGPLAGLADLDRVAFAGHSYGGHTALGLAGAEYDFTGIDADCGNPVPTDAYACVIGEKKAEVLDLQAVVSARAVVSLAHDASAIHFGAACAGAQQMNAPSLYLAGTSDAIAVPGDNAVACQKVSAPPSYLLLLTGGGHLGFSDTGNDAEMEPSRMFALVRSTVVAFLKVHLAGRAEYQPWLVADPSAAWGDARGDAAWAVRTQQ